MVYHVVICGGGNGAHALAALGANAPDVHITLLTTPDEVTKFNSVLGDNGSIHVTGADGYGGTLDKSGRPNAIESDVNACVPNADLICLILPAFVHGRLLKNMAPLIKPGAAIAGMPGQSGFEFVVREALGDELYHKVHIVTLASLPWACRINEYAKEVNILGMKQKMSGSIIRARTTPTPDFDPIALMQSLLGPLPVLDPSRPLMSWSLFNINAVLHESILYGTWGPSWDGVPKDENPLFYQGLTQADADYMESMNAEIYAIGAALGVDKVPGLQEMLMEAYGDQMKDTSNLFNAITTNSGYNGLRHPCKQTDDGKFVPDFANRYFTEDVPNGLVVIKGFGVLSGVPTPVVDQTLLWCQEKMGKEYVAADGSLTGKDIGETRAPQKFGINTKEQLMEIY